MYTRYRPPQYLFGVPVIDEQGNNRRISFVSLGSHRLAVLCLHCCSSPTTSKGMQYENTKDGCFGMIIKTYMSFSLEPGKLKLKETCVIRYSLNVRNVDLHRDEILEKNLEGSADHIVLSFIQVLLCCSNLVSSYVFGSPSLQLGRNSFNYIFV